jgi:oxygen-independent coproporphyrinogen III oxidase
VSGVRHLYVHLPFCAHRCGYCDFVTVVGREGQHAVYVDALLQELRLEQHRLADRLDSIFVGGGTPTFTQAAELDRLLDALPEAEEVTVEANPETVVPRVAESLRGRGVTRISLGAQSFQPHLLGVLERRAGPDDVRRAFYHLLDASFDNISLDLLYGIPGQSASDLERDLSEALALGPEHLSCYELEAKPGTRFTHIHGNELTRQSEAMEGYFERVVEVLTRTGYRWYETANFCLDASRAGGRDLRSQHNLAYWRGRDYLGLGIGAVSTVEGLRWRNTPKLAAYLSALTHSEAPAREPEPLSGDVQDAERLLLGLRLDEPLPVAGLEAALDADGLARMERLGLAERRRTERGRELLTLTTRGRLLGGAVTVELLGKVPA